MALKNWELCDCCEKERGVIDICHCGTPVMRVCKPCATKEFGYVDTIECGVCGEFHDRFKPEALVLCNCGFLIGGRVKSDGVKDTHCPECGQDMGVLGVCYECVTADCRSGPKTSSESKCPYTGRPCDPCYDPDVDSDPCYSCPDNPNFR